MASQVLSGSSNPTYTNNTGQNVRIVINYMASTEGSVSLPARVGGAPGAAPSLTLSWAGVSISGAMGPASTTKSKYFSFLGGRVRIGSIITKGGPKFAIGRNIASSVVVTKYTPGFLEGLLDDEPGLGGGEVSISAYANNAGFEMGNITMGITFPTEIMLRPNETFSAVCGVYNIVVIPEAG